MKKKTEYVQHTLQGGSARTTGPGFLFGVPFTRDEVMKELEELSCNLRAEFQLDLRTNQLKQLQGNNSIREEGKVLAIKQKIKYICISHQSLIEELRTALDALEDRFHRLKGEWLDFNGYLETHIKAQAAERKKLNALREARTEPNQDVDFRSALITSRPLFLEQKRVIRRDAKLGPEDRSKRKKRKLKKQKKVSDSDTIDCSDPSRDNDSSSESDEEDKTVAN